jgi:hypothetical protein
LQLAAGTYYVVLRDMGGDGWTTDEDEAANKSPQLIIYSNECNQYVGSYTFGTSLWLGVDAACVVYAAFIEWCTTPVWRWACSSGDTEDALLKVDQGYDVNRDAA